MFFTILYYDWQILKAGRLLPIGLGLLGIFVLLACWTGQKRLDFQEQALREVANAEAQLHRESRATVATLQKSGATFTGNSHRNPLEPGGAANATGNRYFTLPVLPSAIIAAGQSDLQANYYKFSLNKKQALYHSEEIENASILYNGQFDLAFVIVLLLPLLAIALRYNLLVQERERGTLSFLQSSLASTFQIALAKSVLRYALLLGSFGLLSALGTWIFGRALPLESWLKMMGIVAIYLGFWFVLASLIDKPQSRSGRNAAILVSAWLGFSILVPAMLNLLVNVWYPVPSRIKWIAEAREAAAEARKNSEQILGQFYEDHPELMPKSQQIDYKNFAAVSFSSNQNIEKAVAPLEKALEGRIAERNAFLERFRWFSPAPMVQLALEDLAGTGHERYQAFQTQMKEAHEIYRAYFAEKIFKLEKMTAEDYDRIPITRFIERVNP